MVDGTSIIFFSAEEISIKLKTFAHTEFDKKEYTQVEKINDLIEKKTRCIWTGVGFSRVIEMKKTYPNMLLKNKENLSNFF